MTKEEENKQFVNEVKRKRGNLKKRESTQTKGGKVKNEEGEITVPNHEPRQ